jgi:trk system potassium uptake protein TrkA
MTRRYAVIGLGHFGSALASELSSKGAEVLAIDSDLERLDEIKEQVAHSVRLDATEERALRGQGLEEMDGVIVAIGDNFEATLLAVSQLQQLEVRRIIVRATTPVHERILTHLGIGEIIMPTLEAAERLSTSLLFEGALKSFSLASDYTILQATTPEVMIGKTLQELQIRERFQVSLITIEREEQRRGRFGLGKRTQKTILGVPVPATTIERGDTLVLFGKEKDIQNLLRV